MQYACILIEGYGKTRLKVLLNNCEYIFYQTSSYRVFCTFLDFWKQYMLLKKFRLIKKGTFENIIVIGDPSETYQRPIGDLSETHRRPIRDRHTSSKTDMPHRRPSGVRHASLETYRRQQCLIGDRHASSETNMPHWKPIINTYLASLRVQNCFVLHN